MYYYVGALVLLWALYKVYDHADGSPLPELEHNPDWPGDFPLAADDPIDPIDPDADESFQPSDEPELDRGAWTTFHDRFASWIERETRDAFKIRSDHLLCANVEVHRGKHCRNAGKLTCGKCKLVSYCSKDCQINHWHVHKRDCNDKLMSNSWRPSWEHEHRLPAFMGDSSSWNPVQLGPLAGGLHLWGNVPAMDLVNLDKNERSHDVDLFVACIASGDLRNILKTVNDLPEDYTGRLTILLNDHDPVVVMRNLILLCLLGTVDDEVVAAELALHFWPIIESLLSETPVTQIALGSGSTMSWDLPREMGLFILAMLRSSYSQSHASAQYRAVRYASQRKDYHDRAYARLEPAHRVALQEFRLFGLVLPFGALNAHFNYPNRSLFSPDGVWLQNDHITPLESWDIKSVIEFGKRHGAQRADLFGCLYFFLTDQLRMFARRLRRFQISFHILDDDASELSGRIRSGVLARSDIPASIRFDRIEVSNIMDAEYVGVARVIEDWAPLLKDSNTATIIAYFMNWVARQPGADPATSNKQTITRLMKRLVDDKRIPSPESRDIPPPDVFSIVSYIGAIYDNSAAFNKFLQSQGLDGVLRKAKLRMKKQHSVVPHRNCVPVGSALNSLPRFPTSESWYLNVQLGSLAWSERYVEFCH